MRLPRRAALFAAVMLCSFPAMGRPQDSDGMEESNAAGAFDVLDETGGLGGVADTSAPFPETPAAEGDAGPGTPASRFLPRFGRLSLRYVGGPTGPRLRLKAFSDSRDAHPFLRPNLIGQVTPGSPSGGRKSDVRGSVAVGPVHAGHLELRWAEGSTLSLSERDPHWGSGPPRWSVPFRVRPWPWLGQAGSVPAVAWTSPFPGPRVLRWGGFWIPRRAGRLTARGVWAVRTLGAGGADPGRERTGTDSERARATPDPGQRDGEKRSWIGLLAMAESGRSPPALSLAGGLRGEGEWVSLEVAGDGRVVRAASLSSVWSQRERGPILRRVGLRLRWERDGPWRWSADPRRPPTGRSRLVSLHTAWRFGRVARLSADASSERRWSDARPVASHRRGVVATLSFLRPRPFRPALTLTVRSTTSPRWTEGLGREVGERFLRAAAGLRVVDTPGHTVSLRAGAGSTSSRDGDGSESGSSSTFLEWHGTARSASWSVRWVLGGSSGDGAAGRWLGLYPDASGWVPLPATSPSLWMGCALEKGWGGVTAGAGVRARLAAGGPSASWSLQVSRRRR